MCTGSGDLVYGEKAFLDSTHARPNREDAGELAAHFLSLYVRTRPLQVTLPALYIGSNIFFDGENELGLSPSLLEATGTRVQNYEADHQRSLRENTFDNHLKVPQKTNDR
jgi:hypothetical protein